MIIDEMIKLFRNDNLNLRFTVIDAGGNPELGVGEGVTKDVITSFFGEFMPSYMIGCNEVVPVIRHTMTSESWKSVARIMMYSLRMNYFPLKLSPVFVLAALFGEESVREDLLIKSFLEYLSIDERKFVSSMLNEFVEEEEKEDELLEILGSFKCRSRVTKENLRGSGRNFPSRTYTKTKICCECCN